MNQDQHSCMCEIVDLLTLNIDPYDSVYNQLITLLYNLVQCMTSLL